MKYLSEITRIVTTFQEPNIEILDESQALEASDAVSKLYAGLRSGTIDTDQKAAEAAYGKPIIDTKYTSLKNRLKKRLLNSLFFLNIRPPKFSEYASALYHSNKTVFLMKTLAALGARNTAMKLAQSGLAHAQKFQITANAIEFLLQLRIYSNVLGNEKNYDFYSGELKRTIEVYAAEFSAQEFNDKITIKFARSSEEQPEMISIINQYSTKLYALHKKYDSKNINYYYFRIQNLFYQISRDYLSAIKICNQAHEYLEKKPHLATKPQFEEFLLQKLACYLNLQEYENGMTTVSKCDELIPKTSPNWFIFMELYFQLAMQTEHFSQAESVFKIVMENPSYAFQPEHKKEFWKLFELYLQFALSISSQNANSNSVDLERFLRSVPSYKKDKRGYNIGILILQILLLLKNNEFAEIISRMDALRTYRSRYLRANSNKKSALFFRMLQIMETKQFSYELTKKKSQQYFDSMQSIAAEYTEIQDGLQVLPFDWMWNKILDMLKQKEEQNIIPKVEKGKSTAKGKAPVQGFAIPAVRAGSHE